MRIKTDEPQDAVDGVRSVIQLGDKTYWVDHPTPVPAAVLVQELTQKAKEAGLAAVSAAAESRRTSITTSDPGKQHAYLMKYELVLRANAADETAKNLLTAEATARGLTYEQLRDLITTKRVLWERAVMAIETVEAAFEAAVAAAADRASVDAAVNTAKQLLAEIGG